MRANRKHIKVICEHCGKEFDQEVYRITRSEHHYCSKKCAGVMRRRDPDEKFWSNIWQDENGCWVWQARRNVGGYGLLNVKDKHGKLHLIAHVYAYKLLVGEYPQELELDHLCRNRACANPDHLEPVTGLENRRRGIHFLRDKTHCKYGHPFDEKNTYRYKDGSRKCRECARIEGYRKYKSHPRTIIPLPPDDQLVADYLSGYSVVPLSKKYHVSERRLYDALRRLGVLNTVHTNGFATLRKAKNYELIGR